MGVQALSETGVLLAVGDRWLITVSTTDDDCAPVDAEPTVTVTLPDGTTATPTAELVETGVYRVAYTVAATGRYVARVAATDVGVADFAAWATAPTSGTGMPDVDAVATYLGGEDAVSFTTEDLQDALDAEAAAQRAVCRVKAVYPADMRQALLRRVARNLALRGLPLAVLRGDAEGGDTILPGRDPEVRRLEAPHRKLMAR